jgi:hypothetical protein
MSYLIQFGSAQFLPACNPSMENGAEIWNGHVSAAISSRPGDMGAAHFHFHRFAPDRENNSPIFLNLYDHRFILVP